MNEAGKRTRTWPRTAIAIALAVPAAVLIAGLINQGTPADVVPPPADAEPGRWVHVDGAENTRDVGGYVTADGRTVRRGLVYRSGTLSHVTGEGCDTFASLDVKTVIDYRNRLTPWPLFNGDVLCIHRQARVHGFAVSFAKEGSRSDRYYRGLLDNADAFRQTFDILADADMLPVMYHCEAGKDRTGVMTALLLSLLGVDRATVMADFRLSEQIGSWGNAPAMELLLDEIDKAGGIEAFLDKLGVPRETREKVRANLLEQAAGSPGHSPAA